MGEVASADEGEEPISFGSACAHAEVAINWVASLTSNTTSDVAEEVGGEGVLLPLVLNTAQDSLPNIRIGAARTLVVLVSGSLVHVHA